MSYISSTYYKQMEILKDTALFFRSLHLVFKSQRAENKSVHTHPFTFVGHLCQIGALKFQRELLTFHIILEDFRVEKMCNLCDDQLWKTVPMCEFI